ncbi:hypothetical protein M378DRAFT_172715 [Amanita muscaria Koide BX008]|uniref:Uncharacterized protein n=1 Tax=Amanita muscaria (strain Koide BX008) TaxID=946122 RepID=A0A0C2WJV8_AMAMK|nr:hypothetical protein M378DRAFT_172715 [Amanita muscaria Koide BX008]
MTRKDVFHLRRTEACKNRSEMCRFRLRSRRLGSRASAHRYPWQSNHRVQCQQHHWCSHSWPSSALQQDNAWNRNEASPIFYKVHVATALTQLAPSLSEATLRWKPLYMRIFPRFQNLLVGGNEAPGQQTTPAFLLRGI